MVFNRTILTPFFLDETRPGLKELIKVNWRVNEPDLPDDGTQQRMIAIQQPLAELVKTAVHSNERPLSFAGDCCTTIGVLAGLQRAGLDPTLIWFDAHGDFNTWDTTPSGFLGGMPLAMLVGRGDQTMPEGLGLKTLPEDKVVLTDARDLDPEEARLVEESAVHHIKDVRELLNQPLPQGPLYIHFDVDVIDIAEAPAMSYPAPGGPSVESLGEVFDFLAVSGQIAAVSVSAWNPQLNGAEESRQAVMGLINRLVGDF